MLRSIIPTRDGEGRDTDRGVAQINHQGITKGRSGPMQLDRNGDQKRGALPLLGTDSGCIYSSVLCVCVCVRRHGRAASAETKRPAGPLTPAVRYANFLPFEERKPKDQRGSFIAMATLKHLSEIIAERPDPDLLWAKHCGRLLSAQLLLLSLKPASSEHRHPGAAGLETASKGQGHSPHPRHPPVPGRCWRAGAGLQRERDALSI